jgi:hypothetical protein
VTARLTDVQMRALKLLSARCDALARGCGPMRGGHLSQETFADLVAEVMVQCQWADILFGMGLEARVMEKLKQLEAVTRPRMPS